MANNVYIGMRYVPIYMGSWDSSLSYEALCIVDYGNNTYTSKKPVPAGTLPTDTNYWALTGNYNGAILNLQNRMTAAEGDITALDSEVDKLGNLNMLAGHILFIGDSYIKTLNPSWADHMGAWMGKTLNVDYFISAYSGTGFAAFADGKNYTSLVNSAVVADDDKITCVIAQGGANDIYTGNRSQIEANIGLFVEAVRTRFKNASVVIGDNEGWIDSTYDAFARDELYQHYQQGATKNGAYFIGATGTGLKLYPASALQSDLKHPSAAGMIDIALQSMVAILGGTNPNYPLSSSNGTYYFKESSRDVITGYFQGNFNYVPTGGIANFTCDGANSIDVPITNHNLRANNYPVETNGFVQLRSSDNHYYMMDCTYVPSVNGLKIYPRCMNDNHTNFLTSDINQVTIPRIKFDIIGHCIG